MIIENIEVYGFRAALRGMRNPMNSWDKSDTKYRANDNESCRWDSSYGWEWNWNNQGIQVMEMPIMGPNDLTLACKLIKGGSEHRKFLRQIQTWINITIPLYIHHELDTYKVSTVRNSCSTMHTLGLRDLTREDFESPIPKEWLEYLNDIGEDFRNAKAQKSAIRNHRLVEWRADKEGSICSMIASLPYMKEFIGAAEEK
jgi:hypothetical protein